MRKEDNLHSYSDHMKEYLRSLKYILAALAGALISIGLIIFLWIFGPPIPSLNELQFKWKMDGVLDSPNHIKRLTSFEWEKVCIDDDANGWLTDKVQREYFILVFLNNNSEITERFFLHSDKHKYLELHLTHCFTPDQRFFHKIKA